MTGALFAGLTTIDIAYLVNSYPSEDTKQRAVDQFMGAGGPAANAAVTYSSLAKRNATLITALGETPLAEIAHSDLSQHNVSISDIISNPEQKPSVSSIIVATDKETRTIVSLDAHGIQTKIDDKPSLMVSKATPVVLVDGHYDRLSIVVASAAHKLGIPVVLDGGRWKPIFNELLPLVDIAICSSSFEAPNVGNKPKEVFKYLDSLGIKQSAITRGGKPTLYSDFGKSGSIEIPPTHAIDTLGAGDILHGAFCHYFNETRQSFIEALTLATDIASKSCSYFGTRRWIKALKDSETQSM